MVAQFLSIYYTLSIRDFLLWDIKLYILYMHVLYHVIYLWTPVVATLQSMMRSMQKFSDLLHVDWRSRAHLLLTRVIAFS